MPAIYRGTDLEGKAVEVSVDGGKITSVKHIPVDENLPLIAPPLVDLQHNGARGYAFNQVHNNPETLGAVAEHARRHGVGRLLPTLTSQPYEESLESLAAIARQLDKDDALAWTYPGIFFEGNYMSREFGWRGAHHEKYMRDPDWTEWEALYKASGNRIVIFNVDPSLPNALETIRRAVRHGIRITMGHCGPDPETIRAAVEAGADMVTHFGNGAPPMVHRHRNPFWTWLAEERIHIGLIGDGYHLPGDLLLAAIRAKGRDRAYLVSDSASVAGLPPGHYGDAVIEEGGFTHIPDNKELLAGAWHQIDRGVERLCELGWSLAEAWKQASIIPASVMGLALPRLSEGERAEFVLVRWTEEGLFLEQVVSEGREVLTDAVHPRMV